MQMARVRLWSSSFLLASAKCFHTFGICHIFWQTPLPPFASWAENSLPWLFFPLKISHPCDLCISLHELLLRCTWPHPTQYTLSRAAKTFVEYIVHDCESSGLLFNFFGFIWIRWQLLVLKVRKDWARPTSTTLYCKGIKLFDVGGLL